MAATTAGAVLRMLVSQLAAFEALLLIASAGHKLIAWSHIRSVVRHFVRVPEALTSTALGLDILLESIAAGLILSPTWRAAGGLLTALLWATYLGLIVRAIRQGRSDVDCGCNFGSGGARSSTTQRPLDWFHAARNAVLIGMAMLVAAVSVSRVGVQIEGSQVLAAAALLALYGALDQVMGLRPLRRGEIG